MLLNVWVGCSQSPSFVRKSELVFELANKQSLFLFGSFVWICNKKSVVCRNKCQLVRTLV